MPRRYRSAISWVKRAGTKFRAAGLASFASSALVACSSAVELPDDCRPDAARAARVVDALAGVADGEVLVRADTAAQICFGEGAGTLRRGPVFVLSAEASDDESAARLVHLLHHARHGRGLVAGDAVSADADCDALVLEALREESVAHVLEMQVRRSLGVERAFANQAAVLALPRAERADAVLTYLREHPDGGGGYEPLARDYRERCVSR